MHVGEQDGDFAAGGEELGDLQHGHEVAAVRLAGGGGAPVDFERAFIFVQDFFDDFLVEDFLEVAGDELQLFLRCLGDGCHGL